MTDLEHPRAVHMRAAGRGAHGCIMLSPVHVHGVARGCRGCPRGAISPVLVRRLPLKHPSTAHRHHTHLPPHRTSNFPCIMVPTSVLQRGWRDERGVPGCRIWLRRSVCSMRCPERRARFARALRCWARRRCSWRATGVCQQLFFSPRIARRLAASLRLCGLY